MRRPADMALPEQSEEIHEYRAALMSVFLHTLPRNDPARLLVPSVQPLTLPEAIAWIQRLPGRLQRKARAQAAFRLAVATFIEGREREFAPWLVELLGAQEEEELRRKLSFDALLTPDSVFAAIYEPWVPPPPTDAPSPDFKAPPPTAERHEVKPEPLRRRRAPPIPRALPIMAAPPAQQAHSTLDLENLTTTVRIKAPSLRTFDQLRVILDPRSWDLSPFWPEAYPVELSADGTEFHKVLLKADTGESWHGSLFEHVEWNWNAVSISSFRNFLNVDYVVDAAQQQIRLTFSLYSCEGSTLFIREARNGVDVDRGFLNVDAVNTSPGSFRIDTQKVIRFSDILERRSPLEGPVGSGQILSFMAPAVVGLWMLDLLSNLYFP